MDHAESHEAESIVTFFWQNDRDLRLLDSLIKTSEALRMVGSAIRMYVEGQEAYALADSGSGMVWPPIEKPTMRSEKALTCPATSPPREINPAADQDKFIMHGGSLMIALWGITRTCLADLWAPRSWLVGM